MSDGVVASEGGAGAPQRRSILQLLLGSGASRQHSLSGLQPLNSQSGIQWGSGILAEPASTAVRVQPVDRSPAVEDRPTRSIAMVPSIAARVSTALHTERPSSVEVAWYSHHTSDQGQTSTAPGAAAATGPQQQKPAAITEFFRSTLKAAVSLISPSFAAITSFAAEPERSKQAGACLKRPSSVRHAPEARETACSSQHVAWGINPARLWSSTEAADKRLARNRASQMLPNLL